MPDEWVQSQCAVCAATEGTSVLGVPHPDAPGGVSHVRRCSVCGLRRLDPRPGPSDLGRYYAAASGYNAFVGRRRGPRAQRVWNFLRDGAAHPAGASLAARWMAPFTGPLARWLFDINVDLRRATGIRVLEVGSGFGDILIYLKSRGCDVLGTDLSAEGAAKGREYGVDIRLGNLAELRLPESSRDVAIMCHSLEHVPDPNVELRELHRILRPGGRLHIAVPNGNAVRLALDGTQWMHLSHPLHFWFFDAATLERLVRKHGFEPVGAAATTTRHHALGAWRQSVARDGLWTATRRLFRFLRDSMATRDGGDVLRLVCERR